MLVLWFIIKPFIYFLRVCVRSKIALNILSFCQTKEYVDFFKNGIENRTNSKCDNSTKMRLEPQPTKLIKV